MTDDKLIELTTEWLQNIKPDRLIKEGEVEDEDQENKNRVFTCHSGITGKDDDGVWYHVGFKIEVVLVREDNMVKKPEEKDAES